MCLLLLRSFVARRLRTRDTTGGPIRGTCEVLLHYCGTKETRELLLRLRRRLEMNVDICLMIRGIRGMLEIRGM